VARKVIFLILAILLPGGLIALGLAWLATRARRPART
jgi:hypothetical protein